MGKIIYWTEKTLYLTLGLFAVILFLELFKIWGAESNRYFMFMGDWESLIVIAVIVTGSTIILEKLWKWEVRQIFKPKKRRKR